MEWPEWETIVAKLNASYPTQQIEPPTAAEWYDELGHLDAGDVWLAIRAHRREERFSPGVAEILAGAAIQREDIAAALVAQRRAADQLQARRRGTPMPPELHEAVAILGETMRVDTPADQRAAKAEMIAALAAQHAARIRPHAERVADATRTCGACATSALRGYLEHVLPAGHADNPSGADVAVWAPCPVCKPARRNAWQRGQLADRCDRDGWVKGAKKEPAA